MVDLAIRAESLTQDFDTVRALDGLSLEVPAGIVFGLLGPNGAGKTTTIRLLLGLLEPTSGSAEVLGFDIREQADDIRSQTGAVLEHSGLYERLSARDNLEFFGRIWRIPAGDRRTRIKELLAHLGLWDRRNEPAGSWSRGMRQKLAVARALLHRPHLVFMDEPTSGLDPVAAAALRQDLANLAEGEGATIFLTTHNMAEAEKLCQLVAVIREGRLVAVGSPDELRARSGASEVEIAGHGFGERASKVLRARSEVLDFELEEGRLLLRLTEGSEVAPLVSLLVSEGSQIEEVRRGRESLEQVFLQIMQEGE